MKIGPRRQRKPSGYLDCHLEKAKFVGPSDWTKVMRIRVGIIRIALAGALGAFTLPLVVSAVNTSTVAAEQAGGGVHTDSLIWD